MLVVQWFRVPQNEWSRGLLLGIFIATGRETAKVKLEGIERVFSCRALASSWSFGPFIIFEGVLVAESAPLAKKNATGGGFAGALCRPTRARSGCSFLPVWTVPILSASVLLELGVGILVFFLGC